MSEKIKVTRRSGAGAAEVSGYGLWEDGETRECSRKLASGLFGDSDWILDGSSTVSVAPDYPDKDDDGEDTV